MYLLNLYQNWSSQYTKWNRSDETTNNVQIFHSFTLFANTDEVDTRIVCPICMPSAISSRALSDLVTKWLVCRTLDPED